MWFLKLAAVVLYTGVLGLLALPTILISPSGNLILSIGRFWGHLISATAGVGYRTSGHDRIDWNRRYLFMTNHQSQFDILAVLQAIPIPFRFVAKRNLFWIPVFGWALYLAGVIGIDRSNREKAIRSLDRASEFIRRGASMVVFPEGTRSRDGKLLPFKKGGFILALKAGVPIVPVAITGSRKVLPRGSWKIHPGTIQVALGEPIPTEGFTMDDKEVLMEKVREAILGLMAAG